MRRQPTKLPGSSGTASLTILRPECTPSTMAADGAPLPGHHLPAAAEATVAPGGPRERAVGAGRVIRCSPGPPLLARPAGALGRHDPGGAGARGLSLVVAVGV